MDALNSRHRYVCATIRVRGAAAFFMARPRERTIRITILYYTLLYYYNVRNNGGVGGALSQRFTFCNIAEIFSLKSAERARAPVAVTFRSESVFLFVLFYFCCFSSAPTEHR